MINVRCINEIKSRHFAHPAIYSNAGLLESQRHVSYPDITPLLVNLESMISKSRTVGVSKVCDPRNVEKAMYYLVHICKVNTDSSSD